MTIKYPVFNKNDKSKKCTWASTKAPICEVNTIHELNRIVGYVKLINSENGTVLCRGQDEPCDHLFPCALRQNVSKSNLDDNVFTENEMLNFFHLNNEGIRGWKSYCNIIIESAMQHYGARTYCLDLVDNLWTALWFGAHSFNKETRTYEKRKNNEYLYIFMCVVDTNGACVQGFYIGEKAYTVDLRKVLPSCFLRPAAQHAWMVRYKNKKNGEPPTEPFDEYVACVAKIKVSNALKWLGKGELVSQDNFFPDYDLDGGYNVLLQRQERSGIYSEKERKNPLLFPPNTITNYHYKNSIFPFPISSVSKIKANFNVFFGEKKIKTIFDLYEVLLLKVWTKETCASESKSKWNERNPCVGQSGATAMLVHQIYGGDICHLKNSHHYFNKVLNVIIDFSLNEIVDNKPDCYSTKVEIICKSQNSKEKFIIKFKKEYDLLIRCFEIKPKRRREMKNLKKYNDAKEYFINEENMSEYSLAQDGGSFPIYGCPECEKEQFAKTKYGYYCFSCRKKFKDEYVTFCDLCGTALYGAEAISFPLCSDCVKNK